MVRSKQEVLETAGKLKKAIREQRDGAFKANHPILSKIPLVSTAVQMLPGVDTAPPLVLSPEAISKKKLKAKHAGKAAQKWHQVGQEGQELQKRGSSGKDFAEIMMQLLTEVITVAQAMNASMAVKFPNAYPQSFSAGVLNFLSPITGTAKWLRKRGLDAKDFVMNSPAGDERAIRGKFDLSMNDKGVLKTGFKIHDQPVTNPVFLEQCNQLVQDYLMSRGYEIDKTNPKEPKVVYGRPGPNQGQVISGADFTDLMADDYRELKAYMASAMENRRGFHP